LIDESPLALPILLPPIGSERGWDLIAFDSVWPEHFLSPLRQQEIWLFRHKTQPFVHLAEEPCSGSEETFTLEELNYLWRGVVIIYWLLQGSF